MCQTGVAASVVPRDSASTWASTHRRSIHMQMAGSPSDLNLELQDLRGYLMSRSWATFLICTFLVAESASAQPPVRKFDDPGAPPFKVLKTGENPPLNANDNFVIGPKYTAAPERKSVDGVPQGKV